MRRQREYSGGRVRNTHTVVNREHQAPREGCAGDVQPRGPTHYEPWTRKRSRHLRAGEDFQNRFHNRSISTSTRHQMASLATDPASPADDAAPRSPAPRSPAPASRRGPSLTSRLREVAIKLLSAFRGSPWSIACILRLVARLSTLRHVYRQQVDALVASSSPPPPPPPPPLPPSPPPPPLPSPGRPPRACSSSLIGRPSKPSACGSPAASPSKLSSGGYAHEEPRRGAGRSGAGPCGVPWR